MNILEKKLANGYKLYAITDRHAALAMEFSEDLIDMGFLLIDDIAKTVSYSQKGNGLLAEVDSSGEDIDLITFVLLMMVHSGEVLREKDGAYRLATQNEPGIDDGTSPLRKSGQLVREGVWRREAKVWVLIAPDGEKHEVVNLKQWIEDNRGLFGLHSEMDSESIYKRFREIVRHMKKGDTRRGSCWGWRLDKLPE